MNNTYQRGYIPNYIPNYGTNQNQQAVYEQNIIDQIDNQMNQLAGMKNQLRNSQTQQNSQQQPTAINQTFQLGPGSSGIRYANSIEEVAKETVFFDTPYFSKDFSVLWIKNASGDIKSYELNEIIAKDEKDLEIEFLKEQQEAKDSQIQDLKYQIEQIRKEMIRNEQYSTNVDEPEVSTNTTKTDKSVGRTTKKS